MNFAGIHEPPAGSDRRRTARAGRLQLTGACPRCPWSSLDLDSGTELVEAASGKPVVVEPVLWRGLPARPLFLAEHVPAWLSGLPLKASTGGPPAAERDRELKIAPIRLKNEFYRITVDPARAAE